MLFALVLFAYALVCRRFDQPARLAATVTVALLANAFVCGALSGPHDRYGARIVWVATFTVAIAVLQAIESFSAERVRKAPQRHRSVARTEQSSAENEVTTQIGVKLRSLNTRMSLLCARSSETVSNTTRNLSERTTDKS